MHTYTHTYIYIYIFLFIVYIYIYIYTHITHAKQRDDSVYNGGPQLEVAVFEDLLPRTPNLKPA